ncbi:MAG: hypothetical protein CR986_00805 [Ignavibacteriae bacterium]|nr:MAG: hypothetical protein CR986_00805 [Ignavibacteriota bacterium]
MDKTLVYFQNKYSDLVLSDNKLVKIYTNLNDEINSVKYGVGIYNRSESAILQLNGKEVVEFLQRICTNDISKIESMHYVPTLFTNERGKLIDRTLFLKFNDYYFLAGSKRNDKLLKHWIEKYIITEDVKIENRTQENIILDIIGPQAESYLTLICGTEVDDLDNNQLHKIEVDDTKSFLLKKKAASGETFYWIISSSDNSEKLIDYLLSHKSVFDLEMIGEKAFDYYRTINMMPKFPNEINDKYNPYEIGLINEVSFTKSCYIGQEVITRLDTNNKVQNELKLIEIEAEEKLNSQINIYNSDNEIIGEITTIINNVDGNKKKGLAVLDKKLSGKNKVLKNVFIGEKKLEKNIKILN